jgi:hypothetical protein
VDPVTWVDGPSVAAIRAAATTAELPGAQLELIRHRSARAHGLVPIRLAGAARLPHQRPTGPPRSSRTPSTTPTTRIRKIAVAQPAQITEVRDVACGRLSPARLNTAAIAEQSAEGHVNT